MLCPFCQVNLIRPHWAACKDINCRRLWNAGRQREHYARYRAEHGKSYNQERYGQQRRAYADVRSARLRDAQSEQVDRIAIFVRDGWMCGLCDAPVDPDLVWPDPMSATLDHIVPISRDGDHVASNLRCAHMVCNARRGNR